MKNKDTPSQKICPSTYMLALDDTLNVIHGKWKLHIVGTLNFFGKKRFKELERSIPKITARMLSKELKELEINGIVKRKVYDTMPVMVEYELTTSGYNLKMVFEKMMEWGLAHRQQTIEDIRGTK